MNFSRKSSRIKLLEAPESWAYALAPGPEAVASESQRPSLGPVDGLVRRAHLPRNT